MKLYSFIAFLVLIFGEAIGKHAFLNINVENPTEEVIHFRLLDDGLLYKGATYRKQLETGKEASMVIGLDKGRFGKLTYGQQELLLYLEPNDKLAVHFKVLDNSTTINIVGEGSTVNNNNFIKDYQSKFWKQEFEFAFQYAYSETNFSENLMSRAQSPDFEKFLSSIQAEEKQSTDLLNTYQQQQSLSSSFYEHMSHLIAYDADIKRLSYFVINKATLTPDLVKTYGKALENEWNFVDSIIPHPTYTKFLETYMLYKNLWKGYVAADELEGTYKLINKVLNGGNRYYMVALLLKRLHSSENPQMGMRLYNSFERDNPYLAYTVAIKRLYGNDLLSFSDKSAPAVSLMSDEGNLVVLEDYKGQVVYITFWASWCHVCLKEFKKTQSLREQLLEKGVVLINISLDESSETWRKTMDRVSMPGINVISPKQGEMENLFMIPALPAYFVLDKRSKFVELVKGSDNKFLTDFEILLNEY